MVSYSDVSELHQAGQSAAEIAAALSTSPLTVRPIPKGELRRWLAETGLLRFGLGGEAGWLARLVELSDEVESVLDWLCDALQNPNVDSIRTDSDAKVAAAFEILGGAYSDPDAPAGIPVDLAEIDRQLDQWTGGRKYSGLTEAGVQAVIDRHDRDVAVTTLHNDVVGAIALAVEQPEHTAASVRQAILDALEDR